jgi:methionyl-tRNA formyltransferase
MAQLRILMLGTGRFAVPTFRGLIASAHVVPALITRPVPPASGRRRDAEAANPMRELAEQIGMEVCAPESIKSPAAVAMLGQYEADLLVVCDYGQILPAEALATARWGGINLHASLLPKYRGAAPVNWALYHGETQTGVTVIHMTPRLDAGPCLVQKATPVGATEDAIQLEARLADLGWEAVREAIELLERWDGKSALGHIQDDAVASRAPRLQKSDGLVDWRRSAIELYNQVRAFKPWPGSFTHWQRPKGTLRLLLDEVAVESATGQLGAPGTVVEAAADRVVIACGQGSLRLQCVQPASKNRLSVREFLRGYPLRPHDRLQ